MFSDYIDFKENGIFDDILEDLINLNINSNVMIMKIEFDTYKVIKSFNNIKLSSKEIDVFYRLCYEKIKKEKEKIVIEKNKNVIVSYPIFLSSGDLYGAIGIIYKEKSNNLKTVEILLNNFKKIIELRINKKYTDDKCKILFDNDLSGIITYETFNNGVTFNVKNINRKAEIINDFKAENIINNEVIDIGVLDVIRKVYKTNEANHFLSILNMKDGERRSIENHVFKMSNNEIVIFCSDLTNQKKYENEVMLIKERLELAINKNNLGMFDLNVKTKEIEVNLNLKDMINVYKKENIDFLKEWKLRIHKDDYEKVGKETYKNMDGIIDFFDVEYRIRVEDNSYKWIKTTAKIVEYIDGLPSRLIGLCQDINERKILEDILKKRNSLFQQAFNESNEAIALLDNNTCIIQVNKSFEKLFKYNNENIIGMNIDDLIIPKNLDDEGKVYSKKVFDGEDIKMECIRRDSSYKNIDVSLYAFPIKLENGGNGVCAIYNDISKRVIEEDKIKYLSTHDQLTGIYNRNYYQVELERLNKSRKLPISVIIADIDKLKYVNDNYGHIEGDNYIKTIVSIIRDTLRGEDIFARIGGDEFAIILTETSKRESQMIIDRINKKVDKISSNFKYKMGVSMGVATEEGEEDSLEMLVIKADNKMYCNKSTKK